MSVRHGILAVLDRSSMHGYDLRRELESELGADWAVNYGQVYTTLERLVRDGLVVQSDTVSVSDAPDRKLYTITPAGRAALRDWFLTPVESCEARRDELFAKIVLGLTSEVGVADILQVQRKNELHRIGEMTAFKASLDPALDLAEVLRLDLSILRTEAVIRWLDTAESKIGKLAGAWPGTNAGDVVPRVGSGDAGAVAGARDVKTGGKGGL